MTSLIIVQVIPVPPTLADPQANISRIHFEVDQLFMLYKTNHMHGGIVTRHRYRTNLWYL